MNPRIMAKRPETNMTRRRMMSSNVIGIEGLRTPQVLANAAALHGPQAWRIRASHSGSEPGRQCRP
jgi:hypothetical protein